MKSINFTNQFKVYGQALKTWITEDWPQESPQDIRIGLWGTRGSGKTTYYSGDQIGAIFGKSLLPRSL